MAVARTRPALRPRVAVVEIGEPADDLRRLAAFVGDGLGDFGDDDARAGMRRRTLDECAADKHAAQARIGDSIRALLARRKGVRV